MRNHNPRRAPRPYPVVDGWSINRRVFASNLHPGAKIVLLVILDHARHGQSKCTASNATIAKESRIGVRQVITHIQKLVKDGWIELDRLGETINHGRELRMGGVCSGLHTPLKSTAHPPVRGRADPLCSPPQTNDSLKAKEKRTPASPPPVNRTVSRSQANPSRSTATRFRPASRLRA